MMIKEPKMIESEQLLKPKDCVEGVCVVCMLSF